MNIPDNVTYVLKYAALPVVFCILFFGGLKDAPAGVIMMIVLILTAFESSFIPYDIGKSVADETHPYMYKVQQMPIAKYPGQMSSHLYVTRYYSQTGLSLSKLLKVLPWLLILGIFPTIYFL